MQMVRAIRAHGSLGEFRCVSDSGRDALRRVRSPQPRQSVANPKKARENAFGNTWWQTRDE